MAVIAPVAPDAPVADERISLLPVLALAVPALTSVALVALFVVAEAAGTRPLASPPDANVAEAVAWGDAGQALAFIMAGQDPNQRWTIRQDLLDSRGELHVTAIQAAVLSRRSELVGLMLRYGARAENPRALACLAQAVGIGQLLPPSTFGIVDGTYNEGRRSGGLEALSLCGFPAD
jgi:hypothetical protein